jgi:hypothetical protein
MIIFTLRYNHIYYLNMYLYLVTPLLGSLKNYVKYKRFNIIIFIRTLYIYFILKLFIQTDNNWLILMLERWFFFLFKIIRSIYRNDYERNKIKYINKYGIKYDN